MSKNLRLCFEKLKFISQVKNAKMRKKLLMQMSNDCLFRALKEIALNIEKIPLSFLQKRKLNKYRKTIKALTRPKPNKRLLIKQSGGFLPILIPALASIITSLIK